MSSCASPPFSASSPLTIHASTVIRAGLVSGKLSQVNSSFRVYRSTYRSFGKEQWQLLESRLVQWQASIDSILATIADSRNGGGDAQGNGQQQQQVTV